MPLTVNEHSSAYGDFQMAFASLDTQIIESVIALLRTKNHNLAFTIVMKLQFGGRLDILERITKRFREDFGEDSGLGRELHELKEACKLAKSVSEWRNERIHARVRIAGDRLAVLGKNNKPLHFDLDMCREKIGQCVEAAVAFEAHVPRLVAHMKFHDKAEELFARLDSENERSS